MLAAPLLLIHRRSLLASPSKLPTACRCHSVPSSPEGLTMSAILPFCICQICTALVMLFTNTISDVLSAAPLKCPTPATFQPGPSWPTFGTNPERFAPFISQTARLPEVFSHSTSLWPSLLKSPIAVTCHSAPIAPFEMAKLASVVPLMVQTAACPEVLTQRMSASLLPLKSPIPATCHSAPIRPEGTPNPTRLAPFISQTAACPLLLV